MSTQLILYPQNYQGFSSMALPVFNQYIVDGIDWLNFNNSTSYGTTAGYPSEDAIINSPASIVNTWYRYRTTGGVWGVVVEPFEASGNVVIDANVNPAHSGIYQKMSGLVVGASYDITINLFSFVSGLITVEIWSGTSNTSAHIFSASSTITLTFVAQSTNDIFLLDYEATNVPVAAAILIVDDISITEASQSASGIFTDLQDGQVICDLYQEEDIPLSLSVDDFKNVAEKVQSYSKDFNLPATKRNNKIFDIIFEITRTDTGINFNPYVKTKCVLKQDGYILFDGYLRLLDIKDKNGEISYDVNLYSEVVALADILKDKTLANLDFSELNHAYNKANIKASWVNTTGITLTTPLASTNSYAYSSAVGNLTNTNVLKYPFVDWTGQILLANGATGSGATGGFPELTSLEQAFRPFISLKYIINKIFADTQFTWTSDFFDSTFFSNLSMDFNWGEGNVPNATGSNAYSGFAVGITNVATTSYTPLELVEALAFLAPLPPNYNQSTFIITATTTNEQYDVFYTWNLKNTSGSSATIECQWLHNSTPINYSGVITIAAGDIWQYSGNLSVLLQTGDTLQAQFKASTGSAIEQVTGVFGTTTGAIVNFYVSNTNMVNEIILETLRGEVGQWDFLKGIMTMFNLVTMPDPDNPNNILIEPYSDVFITNTAGTNLAARSIQHDWTDKVDISEMQLTPLTDLNKNTIFKYEEDKDDYAFNLYKNATSGYLYGSKEFDASAFTVLEGTDEVIAEPFAATIPKPIAPQFSDFIVPVIYSMSESGAEEFENLPRIVHINTKVSLTSCTYYIPPQNGGGSENTDEFLQCSHLSSIPIVSGTTTDLNFGECQYVNPLVPTVVDNLFNTYWQPYYNELYNANTRTMTMKVNLTPADVNSFKFNDKVMIKNRVFRVNTIEYKPNDLATVEFILIP